MNHETIIDKLEYLKEMLFRKGDVDEHSYLVDLYYDIERYGGRITREDMIECNKLYMKYKDVNG